MIPDLPQAVLQALQHAELPCFVYDGAAIRQRAEAAASLLDACFFPIKACPELEVVRAALDAGCGLDLCSAGDADIATASGCPGHRWKFTAAAIDGAGANARVWVVNGGVLESRAVVLVPRQGEQAGIVSGLKVGERVVSRLVPGLTAGARVTTQDG